MPTSANLTEKKNLRIELTNKRKLFSQSNVSLASLNQLQAATCFRKSRRVAIYISQDSEFPTRELFEFCKHSGKEIYAPIMKDRNLEFRRIKDWDSPLKNEIGIREPVFGSEIFPGSMDLFFIPLLGFDRNGFRLGRGGGYFDRLFSDSKIGGIKIGVGFDVQECFSIPHEPHDVRMDYILTESRFFRIF